MRLAVVLLLAGCVHLPDGRIRGSNDCESDWQCPRGYYCNWVNRCKPVRP